METIKNSHRDQLEVIKNDFKLKEKIMKQEIQQDFDQKLIHMKQEADSNRLIFQNECISERDAQIKMVIDKLYAEFSVKTKRQQSQYKSQIADLQHQLEQSKSVLSTIPNYSKITKNLSKESSDFGVQTSLDTHHHKSPIPSSLTPLCISTSDTFSQTLLHTLDKSTITTFIEELIPRQLLDSTISQFKVKHDTEITELHLKVSDLVNKKNAEIARLESSLQYSNMQNQELESLIQQLGAEVH